MPYTVLATLLVGASDGKIIFLTNPKFIKGLYGSVMRILLNGIEAILPNLEEVQQLADRLKTIAIKDPPRT